jgi:prefoldin beta subunit
MSDELQGLPPQVQERLLRLQQLQQSLQAILTQKQQVEMELNETEQAISELQKLGDEAIIYKAIGSLFVKGERQKIITDLNERKEVLGTRVTILGKQEERVKSQLKDVQTKLQEDLKPVSPTS